MDVVMLSLTHLAATITVRHGHRGDLGKKIFENFRLFRSDLGLYLNVESDRVEEHYVELVAEKKEAMRSALMQLRREPTARSLFRVFGNLMWGFYAVTHVPLSRYPVVMAEVRKTASQVMQATKDAWGFSSGIFYLIQADRDLQEKLERIYCDHSVGLSKRVLCAVEVRNLKIWSYADITMEDRHEWEERSTDKERFIEFCGSSTKG